MLCAPGSHAWTPLVDCDGAGSVCGSSTHLPLRFSGPLLLGCTGHRSVRTLPLQSVAIVPAVRCSPVKYSPPVL
eukprot:3725061-Pleurochrysis_carterae.AAC.7